MNLVGIKGSGESVWLGWFLVTILNKFIQICELMRDYERAERYRAAAVKITESIENEAWDGSWYRRAYFDDGTPLGSVQNSECMIDSISQSWSVVSGAARPNRMQEAMAAVLKYLVDDSEGIIKLLTPPFDEGILQPGYIKGYVPGVRENGGQYTHAAVWVVLAFAKLGMGDKAGELFHMLNPVNHTRSHMEYIRYKVEPYVMAADVYTVQPQTGRGGWTWYTGASGWLYKVGLEYIAGFKKNGYRLYIDPCIPRNWDRYEIDYRAEKGVFHIEIRNPDNVSSGVMSVIVDGKARPEGFIDLREEGYHNVEVVLGLPFSSDSGTYVIGSSKGKS
jgi:cellobiose phosphorylase